jgi:hypothetical protein
MRVLMRACGDYDLVQREDMSVPVNPQLVCPHCQTKGQVDAQGVRVKRGISGGKATGAVLTGGLSLLATGLSRKESRTAARCGNCNMEWII